MLLNGKMLVILTFLDELVKYLWTCGYIVVPFCLNICANTLVIILTN